MKARRVFAPCPLPFALCFSPRNSSLLQLLECTRPIGFQETGEGAVSQESSSSLTRGTVIRFVRRIDNSLDRCTALRTGFAVAAVRRHLRSERSNLLRKTLLSLPAQFLRPKPQCRLRRFIQPPHFGIFETAGQL